MYRLPNQFVPVALSMAILSHANPSWAAWPDDVTLSGLGTWNGQTVQSTQTLRESYDLVVKQLAVGIANKPMAPAKTLGINGFDVSMTSTIGFIDANSSSPS